MFHQFRANFIELKNECVNRKTLPKLVCIPIVLMCIVMIGVHEFLFHSYGNTVIGLFVMVIAILATGMFNSITEICSRRAQIKSQIVQGMSISSFVWANVVFHLIQCLIQGVVAAVVYIGLGSVLCDEFKISILIAVQITGIMFITIFAADLLGMTISAFSTSPLSAMTILPLFLTIEMIFSGALIKLPADLFDNILGKLTSFTISKWSISLIGTVSKVETLKGYPNPIPQAPDIVYTYSFENIMSGIGYLLIHSLVCIILTEIRLKFLKKERVF